MLAGGRNSRCNPLDESPFSFLLCVSFLLVTPPPKFYGAGRGGAGPLLTFTLHTLHTYTNPPHRVTCGLLVAATDWQRQGVI